MVSIGILSTFPTLLSGQDAQVIAVRAAQLLDGTGSQMMRPGVVLIEGDRIVSVGDESIVPRGARVIDLGDATLLPGLIDLHTHLTDEVGLHWEEVLVTTTPALAALHGAGNARITLMAVGAST